MNPLLIQGFGTTINVDKRRLTIRNPHTKETHEFYPHTIQYDHIVIDGYTGNISFEALRWIMKHGITLTLLNWNGNMLGTWLPKQANIGKLRVKQYERYLDPKARHTIAYALVQEKVKHSLNLLRELSSYHEEINLNVVEQAFADEEKEYMRLSKAKKLDIKNLMLYEAGIASIYWDTLTPIFNRLFPAGNFEGRGNKSYYHNMNASDEVNALLNYGYAVLESLSRKYINTAGLDQGVGYLHEMRISNEPLVYDVQELGRWVVDISVLQLLEEKRLKKSDFIVTEDYHTRLEENTAKALIDKMRLNMNARAKYRKVTYSYDKILQDNVQQLANYVLGKQDDLEFNIPCITIRRDDDLAVREQILRMTPEERKRLGISKTTLWYMQKNLKDGKRIKIYDKVKDKIGL